MIKLYKKLEEKFGSLNLHRPMRISRYEAGTNLEYDINAVDSNTPAKVKLVIEKFVGGGFAGQVYKIKILDIQSPQEFNDLQIGSNYAMKILIPPSNFAVLFRNILYRIGFQGPFQLQVNPTAARSGAIWQKFIRRAAAKRFNDERAVNDIHAIFVDGTLGSCGEISDWVDGRTWRLEVDDHIDSLRQWRMGKTVDAEKLSSPEYRRKYEFMTGFVKLLQEMGAYEFARQYEWTTCKSQPNILKLKETADDPDSGLIAVDFRAGLTLLPFLPMSPGDFKLIWQGIKRGSLVQFDRGNLDKLRRFVDADRDSFADMLPMLDELGRCEKVYRNSLPDITHNGLRLFYSGQLWKQIFSSAVTSWKVRNLIDEDHEHKLNKSKLKMVIFFILGIIPILGRVLRKFWAMPDWRKHYAALFNPAYLVNAVKGRIFEKLIIWRRAGRISKQKVQSIAARPAMYFLHLPFSILPIGLHRIFTDIAFAKKRLSYFFLRPIKLYFNRSLREQWLHDMVAQGQKKHILSDDDAQTILTQLNEPYIQKYLVSLVVHILTLPVTQIVSVIVAGLYYFMNPEMPVDERALKAVAILGIFQVIPISPGSICRGVYTVGLAIKERDFKNYNIAIFMSFFKYIGYLAFPIQMTYRYPALARFMAGHWATEAVHIVPVFGERGALLEHWVFCLFYNWPLTIRQRMSKRIQYRTKLRPRYWHIPIISICSAAILIAVNVYAIYTQNVLLSLKEMWWLAFSVPFLAGGAITVLAGGAAMYKRIIGSMVGGLLIAAIYWAFLAYYAVGKGFANACGHIALALFGFTVFAIIGALLTELTIPDTKVD